MRKLFWAKRRKGPWSGFALMNCFEPMDMDNLTKLQELDIPRKALNPMYGKPEREDPESDLFLCKDEESLI